MPNMKVKIKPTITPFRLVILVLLYFSIFEFGLPNIKDSSGGSAMGLTYAILILPLAVSVFFLDLLLLKFLTLLKVYLIELLTIFLICTFAIYSENKLVCNANENIDCFVIVYGVENEIKAKNSFPFNHEFDIPQNGICLIDVPTSLNKMPEIVGRNFNSLTSQNYEETIRNRVYECEIIRFDNVSSSKIDSMKMEVRKLLNKK